VLNSVGTVMTHMFHIHIDFLEGPYRLIVYRK
jgi:hypothetical protein